MQERRATDDKHLTCDREPHQCLGDLLQKSKVPTLTTCKIAHAPKIVARLLSVGLMLLFLLGGRAPDPYPSTLKGLCALPCVGNKVRLCQL